MPVTTAPRHPSHAGFRSRRALGTRCACMRLPLFFSPRQCQILPEAVTHVDKQIWTCFSNEKDQKTGSQNSLILECRLLYFQKMWHMENLQPEC